MSLGRLILIPFFLALPSSPVRAAQSCVDVFRTPKKHLKSLQNPEKSVLTQEEGLILMNGCKGDGCPNFENRNMESVSYALADGGRFRGSEFETLGYSVDLTKIQNSDLRDVSIKVLNGCNLSGSDLRGATIEKIMFVDSETVTAILDGVDLRGATILEIAFLSSVSVKGALYDSTTKLPFNDEVAVSLGMMKSSP